MTASPYLIEASQHLRLAAKALDRACEQLPPAMSDRINGIEGQVGVETLADEIDAVAGEFVQVLR